MNVTRLYEILDDTTIQLRKGADIEYHQDGPLNVTETMPHESELKPGLEKIDLELLVVGVDKARAEGYRNELVQILNTYPRPERLAGGPSYIEVGAEIGDQGAAFQLFALGQVLGFWKVITPKSLGLSSTSAKEMAGLGLVMISGYRPKGAA